MGCAMDLRGLAVMVLWLLICGIAVAAAAEDAQTTPIYSPWTKFCLKNADEPNARQVCFTNKEAHTGPGAAAVAVVLIEPEGEQRKILRVTLPLGMQLIQGTRLIIDQDQPLTAPYVLCIAPGCMSDYVATSDMIAEMKKGQQLDVQAIASTAQPINMPFSLADFAKAYDGPPIDPKSLEEQQQKLQAELALRAQRGGDQR
jgi:invasion protein IalB